MRGVIGQDSVIGREPREIPPVELIPTFRGDVFQKLCPYPVIVEQWKWRAFGRGRRRYEEAFSEAERAALEELYPRLSTWYTSTGTPLQVQIRLDALALLQRAVGVFATL